MRISRSVPSTSRCLPFLLAGGRGSRLFELTDHTCKPALGFASADGRIVDFILAALVAAQFDKLFVATQYRPTDLCQHLDRHWAHAFPRGITIRDGEFLSPHGYRGTADAVRVNITTLDAYGPREIMILSGDHVLDIDLEAFLRHHRSHARPVTVAATAVPLAEAGGFGIFELDAEGEVKGFAEKPMRPAPMPGDAGRALASTGIYVFDWIWLKQALREEPCRLDFGNDILPGAVRDGELAVYRLPDGPDGQGAYWRDVGTLDAYRLAQLDFAQPETPVALPKTMGRAVTRSLDSMAEGTVFLPGSRIGRRCQIRNAIVGPGVRLPDGFRAGLNPEEDARWFRRTPGGTLLITAEMMARRESALRKTPERPLFRRTPRTPTLSTLKG
ncbi:sugar phosphate nucleotidyltransferase [Salipiger sp. H15]|uniref:Sugar phosphate nucleotidyltransferase n=1 Tax=Alloyangia sp. H15 TaxID=3029062 RepID=A0AAU8ALG7_9RHOB